MRLKITPPPRQILFIFCLLLTINFSCQKYDLSTEIKTETDTVTNQILHRFFNEHLSSDKVVSAIRENILKQEQQKPFVNRFVNYAGYPQWDKALVLKASPSNEASQVGTRETKAPQVVMIPLANTDSTVQSILNVTISGSDTTFKMLYWWQYNQNGYIQSEQHNSAKENALLFMGFESIVSGHKNFKINDTMLFRRGDTVMDRIRIKSFNQMLSEQKLLYVTISICHEEVIPAHEGQVVGCIPGEPCPLYITETICSNYIIWIDEGGGGDGPVLPPGDDGGGGNGNGGSWNDDPCGVQTPGLPPGSNNRVMKPSPCGSGTGEGDPWVPDDEPSFYYQERDANGYLLVRLSELQMILEDVPEILLPCDSLNIMPLEMYGPMWQNVTQFKPSPYVMGRIDSIKNVAPQWWFKVDNFNIQSLENASGAIVNCDFFPVRITQLPTGYTPETLLEYFRKHINSFIDPGLNSSFGPYIDGSFNDVQKYLAPFEGSIGTLWSLKLGSWYIPGIDGSVIESGYSRYNSGGYQTHNFTFSTMTTPLDFNHPVSGNRRFGIYSDPDYPGEYVFYTMGVDRISDEVFGLGNRIKEVLSKHDGFDDADKLWSSFQQGMIQFIQNNNGSATFYLNRKTVARPHWVDVEDYLKGNIDFLELKRRLGC